MSVKVKSGSVIPIAQLNKETNLTVPCFQKWRLMLIHTDKSSIVLSANWVYHGYHRKVRPLRIFGN